MRNWLRVLRVGLPLLLATAILSGCVVSPYPAYYGGVVVAPRPYYYHPYYYGYHGYYHGYDGSGWAHRGHW
jgi:hypothetical protein